MRTDALSLPGMDRLRYLSKTPPAALSALPRLIVPTASPTQIHLCIYVYPASKEPIVLAGLHRPRAVVLEMLEGPVVVGALELAVSDASVPVVLRVVAWSRLLKVYGCPSFG